MRKKSQAQIFLERVEMADSIIRCKLIEQRQWKEIALGITANMGGERVQSSGSNSKMQDAIGKCVDMETEIDNLIDKLIEIKKEVIQTIEQLDSPMEYRILHLRYIQFKALWQIAEDFDRDYGWVTTTHGRAIANVQRILDKKVCDLV